MGVLFSFRFLSLCLPLFSVAQAQVQGILLQYLAFFLLAAWLTSVGIVFRRVFHSSSTKGVPNTISIILTLRGNLMKSARWMMSVLNLSPGPPSSSYQRKISMHPGETK